MDTPLKEARAKKKLSIRALADAVGVSAPHISNIETMKVGVSAELAERLVEALGRDSITEEQILYPERFMTEKAA